MSSATSSSTFNSTPKPKLDLFHDSPCLVAKKCRTSTPSLRPPKPPTKSSSSTRRCRQTYHNLSLQNHGPTTPTSIRRFSNRHEGSFSFGLRDQQQHQHDESDIVICRLNKDFEIISKIGSGNFGDVYKVKSKIEQDKYYAIKRTLMPFTSEADRRRKFQEVKNHQMLPPHDNCVKYYDSWEEDGYLYIQTELCKSNLNQIIERETENKLPEQKVWKYLINLLFAVKHLHDHDLLHLDIKPDNIFISFDDQAKLGDFGLMCKNSDLNSSLSMEFNLFRPDPDDSGILNRSSNSSNLNLIDSSSLDSIEEGDSKYLANEAMQGKFTKAADIYSLGITMFEAASGMDLPQRGETYHKLRQNQIDELYFEGLSDDLVKIIKLMMEADYLKRPLVDDLLEFVRARIPNINYL